jgi:hypothetical protein
MTNQFGKVIHQGTRGVVIKAQYPTEIYGRDYGQRRPAYVVEYKGDTVLTTDILEKALEAAE